MSYQTDNLFKLGMYEVGCIDKLVASGGSNVNNDHDLSDDTYDYVLKHTDSGGEVLVGVHDRGDDVTEVIMVEVQHYLLPRSGARFVATSFLQKGKQGSKPQIKFGWKPWLQERVVVAYVASPYNDEELADVAGRAAERLREEYFSLYKAEMKSAPLEDMVLTRLIRQ